MEFNAKRFRKLFFLFLALTPVFLALRLYILLGTVDPETGFFRASSAFCTAFNAVSLVLFFGMILIGLIRRKKKPSAEAGPAFAEPETDALLVRETEEEEEPESAPDDPDYLHGVSAKSQTWQGTLSAFAYFLMGFVFLAAPIVSFFFEGEILQRLTAVFQMAAGAVFLAAAVRNTAKKRVFFTFCSLAPVIYLALRMVAEYHVMDQPNKSLYACQLLFILSALCFFLYQAELSFGSETYSHPDLYGNFALLTVFFGMSVMLPRILAVLFGDFSLGPTELATLLSDLALTLFAFLKALALSREI